METDTVIMIFSIIIVINVALLFLYFRSFTWSKTFRQDVGFSVLVIPSLISIIGNFMHGYFIAGLTNAFILISILFLDYKFSETGKHWWHRWVTSADKNASSVPSFDELRRRSATYVTNIEQDTSLAAPNRVQENKLHDTSMPDASITSSRMVKTSAHGNNTENTPELLAEMFYAINNELIGSIPINEIKSRITHNRTAKHMVWQEGMPDWIDARKIPSFEACYKVVPPPLPPKVK